MVKALLQLANFTLSPVYRSLFSGKNKKNINLSSAELARKVVKVK